MKNSKLLTGTLVSLLSLATYMAQGQGMAVNTSGATANSSAILDVSSTTQGMLVPRMTTAQRTAISSPGTGLLVYQTDGTAGFYFYNGSAWVSLNSSSSTAGGDLTGTYPNPTIAATSAAGTDAVAAINASGATINSANLANSGVTAGSYGIPGSSLPLFTVNSKGQITSAANTSLTLASAQFEFQGTTSTVLHGNASGSLSWGAVNLGSDITGVTPVANGGTSQSAYTTGDMLYSSATNTLSRLGIGSTGQVLTVAGGVPTWASASGGSGTVTSLTSGNLSPLFTTAVSNATTTPSIAYTLSNASSYTVLTNSTNATAAPAYGKVVPGALYASAGTPSSSTFYRGDGQWATPSATPTKTVLGSLQTTTSSSLSVSASTGLAVITNSSGATFTLPNPSSYTAGQMITLCFVNAPGNVGMSMNCSSCTFVDVIFGTSYTNSYSGTDASLIWWANLVSDGASTFYVYGNN